MFHNSKPRSRQIVEEAIGSLNLYERWNPSKAKLKGCEDSPDYWTPPPVGCLKLNVDGSWCSESRVGAVAEVCRDSQGLLIGGFAKKFHAPSTLIVETLVVWAGVTFVEEKLMCNRKSEQNSSSTKAPVLLVSDNLATVKAMMGRTEISWAARSVMLECRTLMGQMDGVSIAYCSEDAYRTGPNGPIPSARIGLLNPLTPFGLYYVMTLETLMEHFLLSNE